MRMNPEISSEFALLDVDDVLEGDEVVLEGDGPPLEA